MQSEQAQSLQPTGHRRQRRRQSHRPPSLGWTLLVSLGLGLSLLLVNLTPTTADASCMDVLSAFDRDRDSALDRIEYAAAVNALSHNRHVIQDGPSESFNQLPALLQETFEDLARMACNGCEREAAVRATCCDSDEPLLSLWGLHLATQSQQRIDGVCTRIKRSYNAVRAVAEAEVSRSSWRRRVQTNDSCYSAMDVSDVDNTDLLNQREYLIFLNILSGNQYLGLTFAGLPLELRRNYFELRNDSGQIDVSGSKQGDVPTAAQILNLDNICDSTTDILDLLTPPTDAPTLSPSAAPSPTGATLPPLDQECLNDMALSDLDDDNFLNQLEYSIFINLLSDNAWAGQSFADLPLALRRNYFQLRDPDTNQIYIFGSKPLQTPDLAQRINLAEICADTQATIDELLGDSPTGAPTPGATLEPTPDPTVAPTPDPTLAPAALPTLTPTTPEPTIAPTTPAPTSAPTTPAPTPAPTSAPTAQPTPDPTASPTAQPSNQPPPSFTPSLAPSSVPSSFPSSSPTESGFTGDLAIASTFLISNRAGLTADALQSGPTRRSLDLAYEDVVVNVTQALEETTRRAVRMLRSSMSDRRRRLTVEYVDETATIDTIVDTSCPSNLPFSANCQITTGSFNLSVAFEDAELVTEEYTAAMDAAIDDGALQDSLPESSPLTILGTVDSDATMAPSSAPTAPGGDIKGSSGLSTGAIVGIVLACLCGLALAAGAGWYFMKRRRGRGAGRLKPAPGSSPPHADSFRGMSSDRNSPPRDDGYAGDRRSQAQTDRESPGSSPSYEDSLFSKSPEGDRDRFSRYEEESSLEDSLVQSPSSVRDENASQLDDYQYDDPRASRRPSGMRSQETSEGSSGWDDSDSDSSDSESEYTSPSDQDFRESAGVAAAAAGVSGDAASEEDSESESSSSYEDTTTEDSGQPTTPDPPSADNSADVPVAGEPTYPQEELDEDSFTTSNDSTYEESGEYSAGADPARSPEASRPGWGVAPPSGSTTSSRGIGAGGAAAIGVAAGAVGGAALMAARRKKDDEPDTTPDESKAATDADDLESLVEQRDWDGIIATAERFEQEAAMDTSGETTGDSGTDSLEETDTNGESAFSSSRDISGRDSHDDSGSDSDGSSSYEDEEYTTDYTQTTVTETPEETQRRAEYKAEVEALVSMVVPEEIDNVDVMMEQFRDRESELISTLRTMQERSVTQRARAAVHRSRTRPVRQNQLGTSIRDTTYSVNSRDTGRSDNSRGSAAGAAIAAASVPRPASGRMPIHPPTVPENPRSEAARSHLLGTEYSLPSRSTSSEESNTIPRREPVSDASPVSTSESESYTSTSESESTRDDTEKSGSLDDLPSRWKETRGAAAPPGREAPREIMKSKPWLKDEESESEEEEHPSISIGGY